MLSSTDPPGTSAPVLALTNLATWVPELPRLQTRPIEAMLRVLKPTVSFIPTQPLKSLRSTGLFRAYAVRKLGALDTDVMVVTAVAISFVRLASPPPDTVAILVTLDGALVGMLTVSVMGG